MAVSSPLSLLTLSLLFIVSSAKPHTHGLRPQFIASIDDATQTTRTPKNDAKTPPPTRYFEVTKPIKATTKPCSHLALTHIFAYTYTKPPVTAQFSFPSHCGGPGKTSSEFSKIVLEWTATSKGRQFDRIFGVWLDGVELLRSCTAEPRANGTVWTVRKDVTRYYSRLVSSKNQTLSVYLGNLVDDTYTGIYHANVSFHYFPAESGERGGSNWADLILPVSRNLPLNDGLWFQIRNSTDSSGFKDVRVPRNAYRAVLELYVSFHENDEFWYANFPNDYNEDNGLGSNSVNGPFREVLVSLDGEIVGAVWPFTVVFTGGVNPLLWRPVTGIGSFDLPTYDLDITPLLGRVLDGGSHRIGFSVARALNAWYIDANLHVWLDKKSKRTEAGVLSRFTPPPIVSSVSNFSGFDGTFVVEVSRSLASTGWVKSSYGNMTTSFTQDFFYANKMVLGNSGYKQIVDQTIYFNDSASANDASTPSKNVHSLESNKKFSFYMYSDGIEDENVTTLISNIKLGFDETKRVGSSGSGLSKSKLKNKQHGQGRMVVKGNLVQSGLGSLQQVYNYVGPDLCYFRNISTSNYTIFYDHVRAKCEENVVQETQKKGFGVHRLWHFHGKKGDVTL